MQGYTYLKSNLNWRLFCMKFILKNELLVLFWWVLKLEKLDNGVRRGCGLEAEGGGG